MKTFYASMHVGHHVEFLADSWEEGGFAVNQSGEPIRDAKGNTVARFTVRDPLPLDAGLIRSAFAGDEQIDNLWGLWDFCAEEVGLNDADIAVVFQNLGLTITRECLDQVSNLRRARKQPTNEEAIMALLGLKTTPPSSPHRNGDHS